MHAYMGRTFQEGAEDRYESTQDQKEKKKAATTRTDVYNFY